ncbi:MAG: peptide chain release factor N(5)-glutamine methyltransferase [Bradymonadaceae bacterium]
MAREKNQRPEDLGPPWTVRKLLRWTTRFFDEEANSESPRLDAELLLGDVLEMERVELYARSDAPVDEEERGEFRQLVKRRAAGEPVAYLVGHRPFWGMDLKTDDRSIVPRPETEVLVETFLDEFPDEPGRVVDVGTGAGPIAIAVANERPRLEVAAVDVDADALNLARENAARHGLDDRIDFYRGDLLEALPERWFPLDSILSNPPYVPEDDRESLAIDVREHEPEEALFAGPDGLDVIRRLLPTARDRLAEDGRLVVEIGHDQGRAVRNLAREAGFGEYRIETDYSDRDRVLVARP